MNTPQTQTPATDRQPAWLTVAIREIMVKLTDKTFIIGTLSTLALVAISMVASYFFTSRPQTLDVVVTDQAAVSLVDQVIAVAKADNDNLEGNIVTAPDRDAALAMLESGDADVLVEQVSGRWTLTYQESNDAIFEGYFSQVLRAQTIAELAEQAGQTPAQVNAQMTFDTHLVVPPTDADRGSLATVAGFAFAILFMMSAMVYGMQIATSVIEEKQSRIVEILVSVIPVRHLLAGKVLGNTVLAVGQMVLLAAVGLIGLSFTPAAAMLPAFSSGVAWFLVFFLAGFLALACIWAAAGAMCTRSEDLNQTSQPLMWVLILAYVAGFASRGTAQEILSFVPIASSVLMPVRIVAGEVGWWQPLLALVFNLAFAFGTVLVGEKIYRNALLRTQGRLSYREALTLKDN